MAGFFLVMSFAGFFMVACTGLFLVVACALAGFFLVMACIAVAGFFTAPSSSWPSLVGGATLCQELPLASTRTGVRG